MPTDSPCFVMANHHVNHFNTMKSECLPMVFPFNLHTSSFFPMAVIAVFLSLSYVFPWAFPKAGQQEAAERKLIGASEWHQAIGNPGKHATLWQFNIAIEKDHL